MNAYSPFYESHYNQFYVFKKKSLDETVCVCVYI